MKKFFVTAITILNLKPIRGQKFFYSNFFSKIIFLILFALSITPHAIGAKETNHQLSPSKISANSNLPNNIDINKWKRLLHYSHDQSLINKNSDFFITQDGNTNFLGELTANIKLAQSDPNYKCSFPARYYFLTGKEDFDHCEDFQEYKRYTGLNKISVVYASEDASSPVSSLGHLFIKFEGFNGQNVYKEYGLGFVADSTSDTLLLLNFIRGSIDGIYMLQPYDEMINNYIHKENRSLWEYELKFNDEQKKIINYHIFELKSHIIRYYFTSNNCATGTTSILAIADDSYFYNGNKFYVTPKEYIQYLERLGKIQKIAVIPSNAEKKAIINNQTSQPLNSHAPFRTEVAYTYSSYHQNGTLLRISPILSNILDNNTATYLKSESAFLDLQMAYENSRYFIKRLDLIRLKNILDDTLSASFNISFHGHYDANHSIFNPDIQLIKNLGKTCGRLFWYTGFGGGYYFDSHNTIYAKAETGFIIQSDDMYRLSGNLAQYFSSAHQYSGYKTSALLALSIEPIKDLLINASLTYFKNNHHHDYETSLGIVWYF